ncbi:MAG: MBL fold metallo-hydrolase [Dysosmobacter welbionis]
MAFTVPLCAVYFGSLVLISPVSNLLCLTASSLVFTLGLGAVLASFLWVPLGTVIGFVPVLLTRYILWISGVLASVPHHALYFTNPYLKYWLVFLYVLFAAAFPAAQGPAEVCRGGCAGGGIPGGDGAAGPPHYTRGGLDAYVLDVGQGESVLLTSGGKFALVDCGSRNSWYDAGGIAADHLATMGCGTLDYLILTHYDYDHISGVAELLARARVDTLLLPDVSDDAGARFRWSWPPGTTAWTFNTWRRRRFTPGESSLTIYPPGDVEGDNEQGLAVLCTYGDYDLLITGDRNMAAERQLIADHDLPDIEALVVGHHGSKSSTSKELLEALTPETGIISVGDNSYGHPTEDALRRLVLADVEIYRTDKQGTVHLSVN